MDPSLGSCFEAQYRQLDCLIQNQPLQPDSHIKACPRCQERFSHYQEILKTLANLPHSLPPEVTVSHLSDRKQARYSTFLFYITGNPFRWRRWKQLPWYLRTFVEAFLIIATTATMMISLPKLTKFYKTHWIQTSSEDAESLVMEGGQSLPEENPFVTSSDPQEDAVSGEAELDTVLNHTAAQNGLLWRFLFKTVSPDALKPTIIQILKNLSIPENTAGILGHEVPGGIEFDLILPQSLIEPIKSALEKVPPEAIETIDPRKNNAFSWYKVRSKRHLPVGKAQVVIWLSQP